MRVPLETHFLEAYNRDNVELVAFQTTPIECITKSGVRTSEREFEFDLIGYWLRSKSRTACSRAATSDGSMVVSLMGDSSGRGTASHAWLGVRTGETLRGR